MNAAYVVVAVVTALVLAGGILLGASYFALTPDEPGVLSVDVPAPSEPLSRPEPPPALRTAGPTASVEELQHRVAVLEAQVETLTAALEEGQRRTRPMLELYEKMSSGEPVEVLRGEGLLPDGAVLEGEVLSGVALARSIAKRLELDAKRAAAFSKAHARILEQAKTLEKQNAKVRVEGDTTTVEIGTFGADGEQLRREWKDWVSANLTADEAEKYQKQGGDNALFGSRLGQNARTVQIKEAGGSIRLTETSTGADGEELVSETIGPAAGREFVLEDYLHLLE